MQPVFVRDGGRRWWSECSLGAEGTGDRAAAGEQYERREQRRGLKRVPELVTADASGEGGAASAPLTGQVVLAGAVSTTPAE